MFIKRKPRPETSAHLLLVAEVSRLEAALAQELHRNFLLTGIDRR